MVLNVALMLAYLFVGDLTPWGEYLTVWPPLLWCFALVPIMAVGFIAATRYRVVAAVTLLAAFLLACGDWAALPRGAWHALVASRQDESEQQLRVVTWNMDGASGGNAGVLAALEHNKPDIVFAQETPDGAASFGPVDLQGYWKAWHWSDAGDCGLLSRWPLQNLPSERVGPWAPAQLALCYVPSVRGSGTTQTLLLVNVRLMLPSLILDPLSARNRETLAEQNDQRLRQNMALADVIDRVARLHECDDVILAGDFNTRAGAKSLAVLGSRAGLSDAWRAVGLGWGGTITASFPVARIDQVWYRGALRPLQSQAVRAPVSDHRMVITEFSLQ